MFQNILQDDCSGIHSFDKISEISLVSRSILVLLWYSFLTFSLISILIFSKSIISSCCNFLSLQAFWFFRKFVFLIFPVFFLFSSFFYISSKPNFILTFCLYILLWVFIFGKDLDIIPIYRYLNLFDDFVNFSWLIIFQYYNWVVKLQKKKKKSQWWVVNFSGRCRFRVFLTLQGFFFYYSSSSSSCRAGSTDFPDPLSPPFPIVHRLT